MIHVSLCVFSKTGWRNHTKNMNRLRSNLEMDCQLEMKRSHKQRCGAVPQPSVQP